MRLHIKIKNYKKVEFFEHWIKIGDLSEKW